MNLFWVGPDNVRRCVVFASDEEAKLAVRSWGMDWGRRSLSADWRPVQLSLFEDSPKRNGKQKPSPRFSCLSAFGIVGQRELVQQIAAPGCQDLELLPVVVDGSEDWAMAHSLVAVDEYDLEKSQFSRSPITQEIFLVQHLVLHRNARVGIGLFTLADSNRGQQFVTEDMKNRIESVDCRGLAFRDIGFIESDS